MNIELLRRKMRKFFDNTNTDELADMLDATVNQREMRSKLKATDTSRKFVTFEIAKLLKGKGFIYKCFATYSPDGTLSGLPLTNMMNEQVNSLDYTWQNDKIHETMTTAPLWQDVIDWFWNNHDIFIRFELGSEYIMMWNVESHNIEQYPPKTLFNKWGSEDNMYSAKKSAILFALTTI